MNKSLMPKIRFKGFDDELQNELITNLFDIKTGGDIDKNNFQIEKLGDFIYPVYANSIILNGLQGYSKTYKFEEKCITITARGTIGFCKARFEKFYPIVRLLVCLPKNQNFNILYFEKILSKINYLQESTGVPQLTAPTLKKILINYSNNINEQTKVAQFFTIIDKKIELVKEQLTLLAKQKQYYLNNMFTNEKSYPQIRFRGFINENNFQKIKLRTITTIWGGSTPSTKNKKLWLNEIPFITPNFITKNNSMLLNKYERFITDKNFNFSKKNDILLTCRALVGVVTINNLEKCWFSQGIKNIRTGKLINHKYLYYWLYNNKNVLITNSFGTTFLEISNKDLENIQIYITCSLQEQTKIAHFFSIIDRKIELVKKQLSLLVKQKQYYLNNMFI